MQGQKNIKLCEGLCYIYFLIIWIYLNKNIVDFVIDEDMITYHEIVRGSVYTIFI